MNKISCNTIRDILPLYVDEVVSEDTRTMVVEHLGQCAECRKQYENMKTKVVVPVEDDIKPLKRFKTAWKKKKIILVCLTVLITIVIIFGAISIFNQVQKEALQYSQEYVVGQSGIKGNIDVQQYMHQHGGIEPITLIMDTTQITTIIQIQPIMKCGQVVQEIIVEHGKIAPILFRNA